MALDNTDLQDTPPGRRAGDLALPVKRLSGVIGDKIAVDIYMVVELAVIFAIGLAVAEIYVGGHLQVPEFYRDYIVPLLILPVVAGFILNSRSLYCLPQLCRFPSSVGQIALALVQSFVVMIVVGFAAGIADEYSRVWYFGWFTATLPVVITLRALAAGVFSQMADNGIIQRRVAFYGQGPAIEDLVEEIRNAPNGFAIAGVYGPNGTADPSSRVRFDGVLDDLLAAGQARPFDLVLLTEPSTEDRSLDDLLLSISVLPSEVLLYPGLGRRAPFRGIAEISGMPLLKVQRKPISDWAYLVKLIEDYVVAGAAMLALSPLFLLIAAAIKLDSKGPVFFRQRRHGFNHNVINVWKFRTMHVMEDGKDFVQAVRGDTRVTRVGALLRRTSLDELPQLINVLQGSMSIVGPRPHPLALNDQFAGLLARYENRHRVKPGITGWAQIHGLRGPTHDPELMRKRVEYDLEYIEKWSLWMDLKIIAATPFCAIFHKNAV